MLSCTTFVWNIKQLKFRESKRFWVSAEPFSYALRQGAALPLTGLRKPRSPRASPPQSAAAWRSQVSLLSGSPEPPAGLVFRPAASGHCQGSVHTPESELPVLVLFSQQGLLSAHSHCGWKTGKKFSQGVCGWNRVLQRSLLTLTWASEETVVFIFFFPFTFFFRH